MKEVLTELKKEFDNEIWQRGIEYYREGLVLNIIKNNNLIKAECQGNLLYMLKIDLKTREMNCTCPCDFYCKHLAALINYLQNNKIIDIKDITQELNNKSKEELINIIQNLVNNNPELTKYLHEPNNEELIKLINRILLPYNYDNDFLNKLDFVKEQIIKNNNFEAKRTFILKLVDMLDHDPESDMIYNYTQELLSELKLDKKETKEIKKLTGDYEFEY